MVMPAVTPQPERAPNRYARTLVELEAEAHIPLEDQTEEQATPPARASSEAWDEERRQLRLAGGPM